MIFSVAKVFSLLGIVFYQALDDLAGREKGLLLFIIEVCNGLREPRTLGLARAL